MVLWAWWAADAKALPIGFGVNQGPVVYHELISRDFHLYHDERASGEAAQTFNALTAARPLVESWMGQRRPRPLSVIMSAVTDRASFANFITDAIELQTLGQGSKELAWHEYTHATMYLAFANVFGHAGNILHLPWMPAWFLEGLAETLSVSVGSDTTSGVERYQALSGDWPSFDRLHSLYSQAAFAERGYATSGALVAYALRKGPANRLPALLNDFYRASMPWWWPATFIPFANFMPMDTAMKEHLGMTGEELYALYQREAAKNWRSRGQGPFLVGEAKRSGRPGLPPYGFRRSDGQHILQVQAVGEQLTEMAIELDPVSGWAKGQSPRTPLADNFASGIGFTPAEHGTSVASGWHGRVRYGQDPLGPTSELVISRGGAPGTDAANDERALMRPSTITGLWRAMERVVWTEQAQEVTRLCVASLPKPSRTARGQRRWKPTVTCPLEAKMPNQLLPLGIRTVRPGDDELARIWLDRASQKLTGTLHQVVHLDVKAPPQTWTAATDLVTQARPLAIAATSDQTWLLLGEESTRTLRRLGANGQCQAMIQLKDHILDAQGLSDGSLVLSLYAGSQSYLHRLSPERLASLSQSCKEASAPTSPLMWALGAQRQGRAAAVDLRTALAATDPWRPEATPPRPQGALAEVATLASEPPLDQLPADGRRDAPKAGPAQWRGRPLFIFPWIGADDALGYQLGAVSLPLVDEMQNETVRATALYGLASRFPYQGIDLISTRFAPTLTLTAYRQQTYDGRFLRRSDNTVINGYLEEKGGRFAADYSRPALGGTLGLGFGFKNAVLLPYIGPATLRHGHLNEAAASASLAHSYRRWTFTNGLLGRAAPKVLNRDFDYQEVGANSTVGVALAFLSSRATLGLEGARTFGQKRRELQEMYVPLKTFIPGSGGGYNQNSFPLSADTSGLFSPSFGETQGRGRADWTFPVIRDVDKYLWIVYLERLDFTAFYNYGGAWSGPKPPRGYDHLISAHGYRLDLQMENKGVRFNFGLGAGQVVGRPFGAYVNTGFDALF